MSLNGIDLKVINLQITQFIDLMFSDKYFQKKRTYIQTN